MRKYSLSFVVIGLLFSSSVYGGTLASPESGDKIVVNDCKSIGQCETGEYLYNSSTYHNDTQQINVNDSSCTLTHPSVIPMSISLNDCSKSGLGTSIDATFVSANTAPTATNLFLTNTPTSVNKGDTLTLNYTYYDEENNADNSVDVENGTTFKWYKADDSSGTNKSAINGATSNTYTITTSEEGKYIGFSVTPVNTNGTGTETFSTFIEVTDTTAPTIISTTPSDGATEVAITTNIQLMFHEVAEFGSGKIKIVDVTDGNASVEIDVQNHNNQLTIMSVPLPNSTGSALTISPITDLTANKTYRVEIEQGALVDKETTPNLIDANSSVLSFKTPDSIRPNLLSSTPADDATTFNASSNITLTFDENIALGTGSNALILIYELDTDNLVTNIDVTNHNNQLSISNSVLTINLTNDLDFETDYYMSIVGDAITDISNNKNAYMGFSDKTTLNFRTSPPSVDLSSVVTANKWNMIAIPDKRSLNTSDISGATIWSYNNSTSAWEQPTTLTAGKGYWLYTTSEAGYNSISATVVNSTVTDDNTTIKSSGTNAWELVGISKSSNGISWSDIYNQNNTLATGCSYNHIFHYDSANDSWNTTLKVPYLGAVWVQQYYCY